MTFIATAPLVLVKNQSGQVDYAYQGDVIPWLSGEQKKRFLDEGFVKELGEGAGDPGADPSDGPPAKVAAKAEWVAFAVSQGANEAEAEALTKQELVELYGG